VSPVLGVIRWVATLLGGGWPCLVGEGGRKIFRGEREREVKSLFWGEREKALKRGNVYWRFSKESFEKAFEMRIISNLKL
jgi:hypothetical protein